MSPIEQLIKAIDPNLSYIISDLQIMCEESGFEMKYNRLRVCAAKGQLKAVQPGGKYHQYEVRGQDFIDFFLQ